jgi:hypothetical protein
MFPIILLCRILWFEIRARYLNLEGNGLEKEEVFLLEETDWNSTPRILQSMCVWHWTAHLSENSICLDVKTELGGAAVSNLRSIKFGFVQELLVVSSLVNLVKKCILYLPQKSPQNMISLNLSKFWLMTPNFLDFFWLYEYVTPF